MPNPDRLGEFSKLYFQVGDFDTTQADAAILAAGTWTELCVVDVSAPKSRDTREINDRCAPTLKVYTAGKRDVSISVNINELRLLPSTVRAWHAALDNGDIISLLALNDERTEAEAWGLVGNFISEQDDDTQPQEGNNTNAVTFKPAARSAFTPVVKRVYGAGVA